MNPLDAILDPLAYPFFVRALAAASVVGLVCAVVGSYMVLRGLAFMGDALSHSAFPGVVAAYLLKAPFYLGAAVAAVGTALAIGWVTRTGRLRGDTAIGVLFAGMFALGIFLFSRIPNYVGDLFGFLFGEILGIGDDDLLALTLLAVLVLAIVAVFWKSCSTPPSTRSARPPPASGRPPRLPVPGPDRPDDRRQPAGRRDHPRRRDARHAGGGGPVGRDELRAARRRGHRGRDRRPDVGLYLSYWLDSATGATIVLVETVVFIVVLAKRRAPSRRPA